MNKQELEKMLVSLFPTFKEYWEKEDIDRESDGSFTAHGIMSSFTHFYRGNQDKLDDAQLTEFCRRIETVVASDPDDQSEVANAICTSFLEMIAGDWEGKRIEPYLGKACREFYSNWI